MAKASAQSPKCAKCAQPMEKGYVSRPWPQQPRQVEMWIKGSPPAPWLIGTKPAAKSPRVVMTWRCTVCGFLESFAN